MQKKNHNAKKMEEKKIDENLIETSLIDDKHFELMSGAGNLFIVIDNRLANFTEAKITPIIPKICEQLRTDTFSAEGVMLISTSRKHDFEVIFFNPDGSSGMMCGNGARCAVRFAYEKGFMLKMSDIIFTMAGQEYEASINENTISVYFPVPEQIRKQTIEMKGEETTMCVTGYFVSNGTEHFCSNIADIENLARAPIEMFPLVIIGRQVRHHKKFAPKGTNFNIYKILDDHTVSLRTYERGVEAETGACGTGAIATAYSANKFGVEFPITIIPISDIALIVDVDMLKQKTILSGHAEFI